MKGRLTAALFAVIPLAALGVMVWLFLARGEAITAPIRQDVQNLPRPEDITFERIVFKPSQIVAYVRNSGPEAITITGIHVNDMATRAFISPGATIRRLGKAVITIPFDWVEGDPHEVRLVSSTGLFHSETVEVAAMTPTPSWKYFAVFGLLGVYVGVIPVYLGLAWFPFLRRLRESSMNFFLAFTVGLLIFLGVDALEEALELRESVAGPLQPVMLILVGLVGSFLLITAAGNWLSSVGQTRGRGFLNLALAYMIAFGIGVHNLGEGLAIGAAYTLGQATLGGLLVLGFTIHNTTEGIAIIAPIAQSGATLAHLFALGLLAGVPTVLGAWVGGFAYSAAWTVLFLAIGAGAVFQVVYVIVTNMPGDPMRSLSRGSSIAGLLAGFLLMYLTGLMVV